MHKPPEVFRKEVTASVKESGEIGVYAMMWANAFGGDEEEQKTGYRLVLKRDAGK